MSTTIQPDAVQSNLAALAAQYAEAPEPTENGITHGPGKMTVQIKSFTIRELPGDGDKPGYTIAELETEVVSPQNTAAPGQLPNGRTEFGNTLTVTQFLNPVGLKVVKGWARTFGFNSANEDPVKRLEEDFAGLATTAGRFAEVQVKHKEDKNGKTRMNVYVNREVTA